MGVELAGIVFFSFVIGTISSNLGQKTSVAAILNEENENAELWLRRLDRAGVSRIRKAEYDELLNELWMVNIHDIKKLFDPQLYPLSSYLPYQLNQKLVQQIFASLLAEFKDFFADTGRGFQAAFITSLRYIRLPSLTAVISRGKSADNIYLILKGNVDIYLNDFDSKPLHTFQRRAWFGDVSMLLGIRSSVHYIPSNAEPVQALCVSREQMRVLLSRHQAAAVALEKRAILRRRALRELIGNRRQAEAMRDCKQNASHEETRLYSPPGDRSFRKRRQRFQSLASVVCGNSQRELDDLSDTEISKRKVDKPTKHLIQAITKSLQQLHEMAVEFQHISAATFRNLLSFEKHGSSDQPLLNISPIVAAGLQNPEPLRRFTKDESGLDDSRLVLTPAMQDLHTSSPHFH